MAANRNPIVTGKDLIVISEWLCNRHKRKTAAERNKGGVDIPADDHAMKSSTGYSFLMPWRSRKDDKGILKHGNDD